VAGSLADSLTGALWQARRHCPSCALDTEQRIHLCGTTTRLTGGISWLDNDAVNLLGSAAGAAVGLLAFIA
jgi:uncharacterized membrane protein